MYGTAAGGSAGTLAYTGVATGSFLLTAAGLILAGIAIVLLFRKDKKVRP